MITHKQLVEIAYRWILKSGGMSIAFKELTSLAREIPDVIGFNGWESAVIECKVSRSDFLRDQKKAHRTGGKGMGNWRFYCCPHGLIKPEDLPKGWGLIYVTDKARVVVDCRKKVEYFTPEQARQFGTDKRLVMNYTDKFEVDMLEERRLLFTVVRRLFVRGLVKHIYEKGSRDNPVNDVIRLNELP